MSTQEYAKRVDAIVNTIRIHVDTVAEARLAIRSVTQAQKELRQIKKEVGLSLKSIRSQAATQKEKVTKQGFGKGVLTGIFGSKSVGRMNASGRDRIRRALAEQSAPYEQLQTHIDQVLLQLDSNKVQIEGWITQQKD